MSNEPIQKIEIPWSKVYLVNADGGDFNPCECVDGKVNVQCDHYEIGNKPVCIDNKCVVKALKSLGVEKLFGKWDELKEIIEELYELKNSKLSYMRYGASSYLGGIEKGRGDGSVSMPVLLNALKNEKDTLTKEAIVESLGIIGGESAIGTLLDVIRNNEGIYNKDVRTSATQTLGYMSDKRAVPGVLDLLKNGKTPYIRGSAAYILNKWSNRKEMPELLEVLKETAVPVLLDRIKNETDEGTLNYIAWSFSEYICDKSTVQALANEIKSGKITEDRCSTYFIALREIGNKPAVLGLLDILVSNESPKVRKDAAWCLKAIVIQLRERVEKLEYERRWNDKVEKYLENASSALEEIYKLAIPELLKALKNDKDPGVRKEIINALVETHDKSAVPGLLEVLQKDESLEVRIHVASTLGEERFYYFQTIMEDGFFKALETEKNTDVCDSIAKVMEQWYQLPERCKITEGSTKNYREAEEKLSKVEELAKACKERSQFGK